MRKLIKQLEIDYPGVSFVKGELFSWSPKNSTIIYSQIARDNHINQWSLLHELAHAELGHNNYSSDLELLMLEAKAWAKAVDIGKKYKIAIDNDHVQDCLDTYRDWLHKRSSCPSCTNHSLQTSPELYECYNCGARWEVTPARFCRPYRKLKKTAPLPEAV